MNNRNILKGLGIGLGVGILMGVATAMLVAPTSGKELRAKLAARAQKLKKSKEVKQNG